MARRPASVLVSSVSDAVGQQRPVTPAIVQTTTFVMDDALNEAMARGDYRSQFLYTRMGNPTVDALQRRVAELHGAEDCVATASGMGAVSSALFGLTAPGTTVIADRQLYGVTAGFLRRYLEPAGRTVEFVDLGSTAELTAALRGASGAIWVLGETISNPLVRVLDVAGVSATAHAHGARLLVDNTFAGPLVCRPLEHGADLVLESLSKSFAGHSDVHGGALAGNRGDIELCWQAMLHFGACLDPHASWLIQRGSRTLKVRTDVACRNAGEVARFLKSHPAVLRVWYPGLQAESLPDALLSDFGSMLSFSVIGGDERALRVLDALQVIVPATSLGGVESLVSLPFNTSHRTPEAQAMIGLLPGTIRLSVGIEDVRDLIDDLDSALRASA